MKTTRLAVLLGSVALVAGCAADAPNALSSSAPAAATVQRVDNFLLADTTMVAHELYRLADASAVVIVTQANGDDVVRGLAPQLNRMAADYGSKGVEVLMLNPTQKDTLAGVQAEVAKAGFKVPVLMDNNQLIGEALGVTRSAEAVVINPKTWQVVYRGAATGAPAALDAMLAGRPVSAGAASNGAPIAFPNRGAAGLTYVRHVAPILEKNCVACHQAGGIGPMQLTSYEMVKGFAPMIREVVRTDRMPPYAADPRVNHFSDNKNMTPDEIRTLVHWVESGAPRGEGADPLAAVKRVAAEWPLGKPDLILKVPSYKVPASGTVDYQRPFTPNPETEGRWIRATSVKPGDRQAVHHLLSGWMEKAPAAGRSSSEGNWKNSVGRYAVGSEADIYDGNVGTYLPAGGAVGFQMHYTPYGKEAVDNSEVGIYFRKDAPKYIMRQVAISDPSIAIPANSAYHLEQAYLEFPKAALLYSAFVHAHYRATASDLWIQYADGKKELLLSMPRYDFNWQRAYTFAKPVNIPAGAKLIARYWYNNSKRNPANPDPKIEVTWGEQSWQEMLFTQIEFRWMDETAAAQIDSDARFGEGRIIGMMDDNLDGKLEKAELRGQMGKNLIARWAMLNPNGDAYIERGELVAGMKAMQMFQRRPEPQAATPAAAPGGR